MDGTTFVGRPLPLLAIVLTGLVSVTVSTPTPVLAAAPHQCVTARVDASFRLPDGVLYPAGPLTLCETRAFSPVDNLHKILVDGSSVGMFVSRKRSAESRGLDAPQFLFKHDVEGNLELVGYTVPKSGRSIAYRLKSHSMTLRASSPPPSGGGTAAPVAAIVATSGTR